jgi:hypothetical protein
MLATVSRSMIRKSRPRAAATARMRSTTVAAAASSPAWNSV